MLQLNIIVLLRILFSAIQLTLKLIFFGKVLASVRSLIHEPDTVVHI